MSDPGFGIVENRHFLAKLAKIGAMVTPLPCHSNKQTFLRFVRRCAPTCNGYRVAQLAEILDLRKRLASGEEADERASSVAMEEAAKVSLQIALLSDSARRAAANAANISTLVEDLMTNVRPTAASRAQTPPPEIQYEPDTPDSPHDHVQLSSTEDADGFDSS